MVGAADEVFEAYYTLLLDFEKKAINYLLLGNGAGLAGSVATLKDYATRNSDLALWHRIDIEHDLFCSIATCRVRNLEDDVSGGWQGKSCAS